MTAQTPPEGGRFRRSMTQPQRIMGALMGIALVALVAWGVVELVGVFNPGTEDTWTEWVADLGFGWVLTIVGGHLLAGFLFIGSAWHFIEWYAARRKAERGE